jgi:ATP-dependent Clp endopeptidase proteolytic subunit ClpP
MEIYDDRERSKAKDFEFNLFIKNRIITITDEIEAENAQHLALMISHQIMHLTSDAIPEDERVKPIHIELACHGGSVTAGQIVIDAIEEAKKICPVYTYAMGGITASMGAQILIAGSKRFAYPDASIMFHEGSSGNHGTVSNFKAGVEWSNYLSIRLIEEFAYYTGSKYEDCAKDRIIDQWYSGTRKLDSKHKTLLDAKNYGSKGIIDEILIPDSAKGREFYSQTDKKEDWKYIPE